MVLLVVCGVMGVFLMLVEERRGMQYDEHTVPCLYFVRCDVPLVQNKCLSMNTTVWILGKIGVVGQFSDCRPSFL